MLGHQDDAMQCWSGMNVCMALDLCCFFGSAVSCCKNWCYSAIQQTCRCSLMWLTHHEGQVSRRQHGWAHILERLEVGAVCFSFQCNSITACQYVKPCVLFVLARQSAAKWSAPNCQWPSLPQPYVSTDVGRVQALMIHCVKSDHITHQG